MSEKKENKETCIYFGVWTAAKREGPANTQMRRPRAGVLYPFLTATREEGGGDYLRRTKLRICREGKRGEQFAQRAVLVAAARSLRKSSLQGPLLTARAPPFRCLTPLSFFLLLVGQNTKKTPGSGRAARPYADLPLRPPASSRGKEK